MNLYVLIIIEFVLLLFTYQLFDQDIISPPVITELVFLLATILVIPSASIWEVEISTNTILVIITGFVTLTFSSYITKKCFKRKRKGQNTLSIIHCKRGTEHLIFILSVLLTCAYCVDAIHVGQLNGGSGLGAIAYMKQAYTSGSGVRMNPIIRQGFKIVMLFAYISAFLFADNVLVFREKLKRNIEYFTAILCGCIITIFSGSRTEILRIISAILLCYSMLYREKNGWRRRENARSFKSILKKFLPILIIFIVIAFGSRALVKTAGTGGSEISSVIQYLSYYVGSPIQVLNIKNGYYHGIGELMFGSSANIPEFVYLGNLNYGGNVGSLFGSFYEYNGLLNMIFFLFIVYFLGSGFYYSLYGTHSSIKRNRWLIAFSYIYFVFTMSYYSDCVSELFEFSNIVILILILVFIRPLLRQRVRNGME